MKYYKRYWEETTGEDLTDSWGKSTYYFEVDSTNIPVRQIQVFENLNVLKYSSEKKSDEFGFISDQPLDEDEFSDFQIGKDEFEKNWIDTNRKQIKKPWWKFGK